MPLALSVVVVVAYFIASYTGQFNVGPGKGVVSADDVAKEIADLKGSFFSAIIFIYTIAWPFTGSFIFSHTTFFLSLLTLLLTSIALLWTPGPVKYVSASILVAAILLIGFLVPL